MNSFSLSIVAPDRSIIDGEAVTSVILPGHEGYFGVQAGHEALIAALKTGVLEYLDTSNQRHYVTIGAGFVEISNNKLSVLTDFAERSSEVDIAKAEEALAKATAALRGEHSTMNNKEAVEEIERATALLKAARSR